MAIAGYLESKYSPPASSLHPFYQSLGYHYCNARGHHDQAFKYTLKAADWAIRKCNYDIGLENLRVAARITRSSMETNIVLEVLNRTVRELSKKVEAQKATSPGRLQLQQQPSSTLFSVSGPGLVLGLHSSKKAAPLTTTATSAAATLSPSPGGNGPNSPSKSNEETMEVLLLRKFRELKSEIDAQLLAAESQLAAQRLQAMNNAHQGSYHRANAIIRLKVHRRSLFLDTRHIPKG